MTSEQNLLERLDLKLQICLYNDWLSTNSFQDIELQKSKTLKTNKNEFVKRNLAKKAVG